MLDERKMNVLRAVVEDFVATREPVGSKAIVDRHRLDVSPATIRNDMSALEEGGYLAAPHTSAGRVPTDKGYRLFVDRLSSIKPLSSPERRAIAKFLNEAVDLDDVMTRTVRLLSQATGQVAVVQYPSLTRSSVRHLELIDLGAQRLSCILITDNGRVEQRLIDLTQLDPPQALSAEDLALLRDRLNEAIAGRPLAELTAGLAEFRNTLAPEFDQLATLIEHTLEVLVADEFEERILLAGTSNLVRSEEDFATTFQQMLDLLEEQVVLLRLFRETGDEQEAVVRIGHENQVDGLQRASTVSIGYGDGRDMVARLGVLGPTRMDYAGNIAAVRAVARYVGRVLADQR